MHDTTSQHPVEYLFSQLGQFGSYPEGVKATSTRIAGLAFFPGGAGLKNAQPGLPLPPMPIGGVMVLGHIFNHVAGYDEAVSDNSEKENSATWKPLLGFLHKCYIAAPICFFTNGYMGLKRDSKGSFGAFFQTLLRDFPEYIERCRGFLVKQLQAQQPRLLLVLGKDVWPVLTPLAPELSSWSMSRNFQDLDERHESLIRVRFGGLPHDTIVVALTQPTQPYHRTNVEQRIYRDQHGGKHQRDDAEIELVRAGWMLALAGSDT